MQCLGISVLTPSVHRHSRTWCYPAHGRGEAGCQQRQVEDRSRCGTAQLSAHSSHGPALLPPQPACTGARLMESLQLSVSLLLPSVPEHQTSLSGMVAEHPLQCYREWPCQPALPLGHLGSVISTLFFPIQFRFVAVHWTVGFSRFLGTDECLVSQNRVNSLLCLSLCLLLRSSTATVIEEGPRETGTNAECWRRQDKKNIAKPIVPSCFVSPCFQTDGEFFLYCVLACCLL